MKSLRHKLWRTKQDSKYSKHVSNESWSYICMSIYEPIFFMNSPVFYRIMDKIRDVTMVEL